VAVAGTRSGAPTISVRIWWLAAIAARCPSDSRQVFSSSATWSAGRALSRYSAMVLGSKPPGPVFGGAVRLRRRVTCLMRLINSWAASLSATLAPICLISAGSRVSSGYASRVRKVRRTGKSPGPGPAGGRQDAVSVLVAVAAVFRSRVGQKTRSTTRDDPAAVAVGAGGWSGSGEGRSRVSPLAPAAGPSGTLAGGA